jgi:hypothetical protein
LDQRNGLIEMTKDSKKYVAKTLTAIGLIILGLWGIHMGGKTNFILGGICFLTGFIMMAVMYGSRWIDSWWGL